MTKSNTKAFTLIELLIVIVIIGILAVALIPRLTGAQASARDAARVAGVQQVQTAAAQWIAENAGVDLPADQAEWETALNADYLSSYPDDPKGSNYGIIEVTTSGSVAVVCAVVEREAKGNSAATGTTAALVAGPQPYYCQIAR